MRKFLALFFIASFLLCGCTKNENEAERQNRFAVEYSQAATFLRIMIIRDTETGKAYLFVKDGYGGGLTALEEQEERDGEKVVP